MKDEHADIGVALTGSAALREPDPCEVDSIAGGADAIDSGTPMPDDRRGIRVDRNYRK